MYRTCVRQSRQLAHHAAMCIITSPPGRRCASARRMPHAHHSSTRVADTLAGYGFAEAAHRGSEWVSRAPLHHDIYLSIYLSSSQGSRTSGPTPFQPRSAFTITYIPPQDPP